MTNLILPKKRKLITTAVAAAAGLLLAQPASPAIILAPSISAALEAIGFERPHHKIAPDVFAMFTMAKFAAATQGGGAAAAVPPAYIASVTNTNIGGVNALSITGLTTAVAGDILIAIGASRSNGDSCTASSYTQRVSYGYGSPSLHMSVLSTIAVGGETGVTLNFSIGSSHSGALLLYRPGGLGAFGTGNSNAATNVTANGITCVGGTIVQVTIGQSNLPPTGISGGVQRVGLSPGSYAGIRVADAPSVAGATGSIVGGYSDDWVTSVFELTA